jgi:hypothetical protein
MAWIGNKILDISPFYVKKFKIKSLTDLDRSHLILILKSLGYGISL